MTQEQLQLFCFMAVNLDCAELIAEVYKKNLLSFLFKF